MQEPEEPDPLDDPGLEPPRPRKKALSGPVRGPGDLDLYTRKIFRDKRQDSLRFEAHIVAAAFWLRLGALGLLAWAGWETWRCGPGFWSLEPDLRAVQARAAGAAAAGLLLLAAGTALDRYQAWGRVTAAALFGLGGLALAGAMFLAPQLPHRIYALLGTGFCLAAVLVLCARSASRICRLEHRHVVAGTPGIQPDMRRSPLFQLPMGVLLLVAAVEWARRAF